MSQPRKLGLKDYNLLIKSKRGMPQTPQSQDQPQAQSSTPSATPATPTATPKVTPTDNSTVAQLPTPRLSIPEPTWSNFDSFKEALDRGAGLPPKLSPTLPTRFTKKGGEEKTKVPHQALEIPRMLSPTLPSRFLAQPAPRLARRILLDDEEEEDEETEEKAERPRNFEEVKYEGTNSYSIIRNSEGEKLLVTFYVPKWFKAHPELKEPKPPAYKIKKKDMDAVVGFGIKLSKKRESTHDSEDENPRRKLAKLSPKESPKEPPKMRASSPITPPKDTPPTPQDVASMSDADKRVYFKNEFQRLLSIAKDTKHKADALKETDVKKSLIAYMDCIVIYLVAFHCDQQSRALVKRLYTEQMWVSTLSLLDHIYRFALNNHYRDLAGLALQVKSAVCQHLQTIYDVLLLNCMKAVKTGENLQEVAVKMEAYVEEMRKHRDIGLEAMFESVELFGYDVLKEKFPEIVETYNKEFKGIKRRALMPLGEVLDPMKEQFVVPFEKGLNIRQVAAYALRVIKAWDREHKVGYSDWIFE